MLHSDIGDVGRMVGTDGSRVWALIVISGKRQYGGHKGYEDNPTKVYPYDSAVANSRRLSEGDVVLLRDSQKMLGVARVEQVVPSQGSKQRLRCPECRTTGIKGRKKKKPRWRCNNGHEFDVPLEETVKVTQYEARFKGTFRSSKTEVSASEIKETALRPNDQLSIEELDPHRLALGIASRVPYLAELLEDSAQRTSLHPEDADEYADEAPADYQTSIERRNDLLKTIRARRGQSKFRKQLIRRYGARCMISRFPLLDIVEAAHIRPYRRSADNHPDNGLLLRADLHTLFDLNHMGIDPETLHVHFSTDAREAGYDEFHDLKIKITARRGPSREALSRKWDAFLRSNREPT